MSPKRVILAYLAATVAADAGFNLGLLVDSSRHRQATEAWQDLVSGMLIGGPLSLVFTLVLGLAGWLALRERRWTGYFAYGATGGALAALSAGVAYQSTALMRSFGLAGTLGGLLFRYVYYRRGASRNSRHAAA